MFSMIPGKLKNKNKTQYAALGNFHGVHIFTVWHHWMQNWEEPCRSGPWTGSNTPRDVKKLVQTHTVRVRLRTQVTWSLSLLPRSLGNPTCDVQEKGLSGEGVVLKLTELRCVMCSQLWAPAPQSPPCPSCFVLLPHKQLDPVTPGSRDPGRSQHLSDAEHPMLRPF